jgi:hypothetical protein
MLIMLALYLVLAETISYCVKDASGQIDQDGKIGAKRLELDDG